MKLSFTSLLLAGIFTVVFSLIWIFTFSIDSDPYFFSDNRSDMYKDKSVDVTKTLNELDDLSFGNPKVIFPIFQSTDEYFYGASRLSVLNNGDRYLILIEKIIFHDLGKITNEVYYFGNVLEEISSNSGYNLTFSTIVDYSQFEKIINADGFVDINLKTTLWNQRGETLNHVSEKFWEDLNLDSDFVSPEFFFWGLIEANSKETIFLSQDEIFSIVPKDLEVVNSCYDWYYESLADESSGIPNLTIKPSKSVAFTQAVNVLFGQENFEFSSINTNWENWK